MNSLSDALDALGGKKPNKVRMNLSPLSDGKVLVRQDYYGGSESQDPEETDHDQESLHAHIDKHYFKKKKK